MKTHRPLNDIWAYNKYYNAGNLTILLNSHDDTVKPARITPATHFVPISSVIKFTAWAVMMPVVACYRLLPTAYPEADKRFI